MMFAKSKKTDKVICFSDSDISEKKMLAQIYKTCEI